MENSLSHRRLFFPDLDPVTAVEDGLYVIDVDSDSDQVHDLYERDGQRTRQSYRSRERYGQLSCSIQAFTGFDPLFMDEDDIPTRDAGLDLSFPNNANSSCAQSDPDQDISGRALGEAVEQSRITQDHRGISRKKKTKTKRRKETERSRNNNSLNFQQKLEQLEKGEFDEEETRAEDCGDLPIDRCPSCWKAERPFELAITAQNVDMLLISASFYQQSHVIGLCKDVLLNCNLQDALYYRFVAEKHELVDIIPYLVDFVRANFTSLVHTHSFLGLGMNQLKALLSDDSLKVQSELDVFHAARTWIDHCRHSRIKQVGEVMACVRFIHIPPEDIVQHVEPHKNYFKGPGGREVLLSIYRYHALIGSQSDPNAFQGNLLTPRCYIPLGNLPTPSSVQYKQSNSTREVFPDRPNTVSASLLSPIGSKTSVVPCSTIPTNGIQMSSTTVSQLGDTQKNMEQAQGHITEQDAQSFASEVQPLAKSQSRQQATQASRAQGKKNGFQRVSIVSQFDGIPEVTESTDSHSAQESSPQMIYTSTQNERVEENVHAQYSQVPGARDCGASEVSRVFQIQNGISSVQQLTSPAGELSSLRFSQDSNAMSFPDQRNYVSMTEPVSVQNQTSTVMNGPKSWSSVPSVEKIRLFDQDVNRPANITTFQQSNSGFVSETPLMVSECGKQSVHSMGQYQQQSNATYSLGQTQPLQNAWVENGHTAPNSQQIKRPSEDRSYLTWQHNYSGNDLETSDQSRAIPYQSGDATYLSSDSQCHKKISHRVPSKDQTTTHKTSDRLSQFSDVNTLVRQPVYSVSENERHTLQNQSTDEATYTNVPQNSQHPLYQKMKDTCLKNKMYFSLHKSTPH